MLFNSTFNNISVISWQSVLLMEETGVPDENHQPVANHWQTLSHNVSSSTNRDVNRFWGSRRKLKSSRQIDAPFTAGVLGAVQGSGINGAKSCILGLSWHLISLLKLHFFVLFFSYFQQLFNYFWLYCGSDSGTSICWLQRCIKILFLQCNLTWKIEQLTYYECSLIQHGDENDSEGCSCIRETFIIS